MTHERCGKCFIHGRKVMYAGGSVIDPMHLAVLRTILTRLRGSDVTWAVTGSLGFALQGMPINPHDIDIQTDQAGVYEIERRLNGYVTRRIVFAETERIRSHFGAAMLDGIAVEIMGALQKRLPNGAWEPPVDVAPHTRIIEVEALRVPVLSLDYEY